MKKLLFILFVLFTSSPVSNFAQERGTDNNNNTQKWIRIDELKLQFVLKKLALPSNTQEKLTPLYKEYQSELRAVYSQRKKLREQNKANPEKQVDTDFSFESKILDIKQNYKKKFQIILSPEQLNEMYSAEREFRQELMQQLKRN